MSPSSNSVYSSVFTYIPYVLTRPYQHLTFVASIELHHITCVSHDISVSVVGFGDRAHVCRMDTPTSRQKRTRRPSKKLSWLVHLKRTVRLLQIIITAYPSSPFEFFALFAALLLVILTLGNDGILVAYQINAGPLILMHVTGIPLYQLGPA